MENGKKAKATGERFDGVADLDFRCETSIHRIENSLG